MQENFRFKDVEYGCKKTFDLKMSSRDTRKAYDLKTSSREERDFSL